MPRKLLIDLLKLLPHRLPIRCHLLIDSLKTQPHRLGFLQRISSPLSIAKITPLC
jgi:hypothetical protein